MQHVVADILTESNVNILKYDMNSFSTTRALVVIGSRRSVVRIQYNRSSDYSNMVFSLSSNQDIASIYL